MVSNRKLQRYVDRIENLDSTIKEHNTDKSEVYKDAKSEGFDVKVRGRSSPFAAVRRQGPENTRKRKRLSQPIWPN
jgi:uncharacterized protein (UPF0335 family)